MAIDPSKLIDVGTTANDGTGDPLRTAFQKANTLFTELWDDDEGDVNSVTGSGGLTASPTTGAVVVNLDDDSITGDKIGTQYKTAVLLGSGQNNIDFEAGQIFTKTLDANTTLTFSNAITGDVKILYMAGNFDLALPTGQTISGAWVPNETNVIQVLRTGSVYIYSISQLNS